MERKLKYSKKKKSDMEREEDEGNIRWKYKMILEKEEHFILE